MVSSVIPLVVFTLYVEIALCVPLALNVAARSETKSDNLEINSFEEFERHFAKAYPTEEHRLRRKAIFERRLAEIKTHNTNSSKTYQRGVNHFSDLESFELPRGLNKPLLMRSRGDGAVDPAKLYAPDDIPPSVDWRTRNVLTPVKDQGDCGSCWSFASTETIESHWAIKTGELEELSEQFILDCVPNPQQCGGTGGCDGGTGELAYSKLHQLGGIPSEWKYPYLSGDGSASKCHGLPLSPQKPHQGKIMAAANITGHVSVTSNSYRDVLTALATVGPMAISVSTDGWDDYKSGIFGGGNHSNPDLDHMVQLVGYGSDNGQNYWLVRNSWTALWGEGGYIRLTRPADGEPAECGIDLTPGDGNGCAGGPNSTRVCGQNGLLFDAVYPLVV